MTPLSGGLPVMGSSPSVLALPALPLLVGIGLVVFFVVPTPRLVSTAERIADKMG
jgi:hypothetical protein